MERGPAAAYRNVVKDQQGVLRYVVVVVAAAVVLLDFRDNRPGYQADGNDVEDQDEGSESDFPDPVPVMARQFGAIRSTKRHDEESRRENAPEEISECRGSNWSPERMEDKEFAA